MRKTLVIGTGLIVVLAVAVSAQPSATLTLESSKNGLTVAPGTTIDWTVSVAVSAGDNVGLALVSVDLVNDATNPAFFDIPPAVGVPSGMTNFSRPAGISNPGEGGSPTGYIGVQRGTAGQKILKQIGGGQNTFGQAGTTIGTNPNVVGGVGQSGAQIVATGSFPAPATNGTYTFRLQNPIANVLDSISALPNHSPVSAATTNITGGVFSFTVGPTSCPGDTNCDTQVDFGDINAFVDAILNSTYCDGTGANADVSNNGTVGFEDINPFVGLLTNNPLPINCP